MSVKIAGIWEQNWNIPLSESYLWTFPLREFAVTDWAMTPVTGIQHNERHSNLQLKEYQTVKEMIDGFSNDHVRVFVDEKGETSLHEFIHPENAIYFFGNAGRSPMEQKRPEDMSVCIPTIINAEPGVPHGVMWPHQCLVTVLYDRLRKSWQ